MQKVYGDKAPEAWQKLAAKTVTVTKGWSEAYGPASARPRALYRHRPFASTAAAPAPGCWCADLHRCVTKGWSEAYGLFLKGESDLVLSYTTSPAYHMIEEKKDHYAAANFAEGHYLQVEVAASSRPGRFPLSGTDRRLRSSPW
jgi:thiamine transport system substrate-binding protein